MMPVFSRAGVSRINASAVERDVLIIIDPQVDFCPGGAPPWAPSRQTKLSLISLW
jgi:hypothetical protein